VIERERVQDHAWDEARAVDRQQRAKLLAARPPVVHDEDVPREQSQPARFLAVKSRLYDYLSFGCVEHF
jgi:hypothetical protein